MNSDPHESAAWRTFGMLDADESASFDDAMRRDPDLMKAYREMDSLAAAVAVVNVPPLTPRAGQLERLHARLGLNVTKPINWLGITGWSAAAILTAMFVLGRQSGTDHITAQKSTEAKHTAISDSAANTSAAQAGPLPIPIITSEPSQDPPGDLNGMVSTQENEVKTIAKAEAKRLIQEIEVLREKLENVQDRDRKRFEPVAGMAWPIIMTMSPPGVTSKEPAELAIVDSPASPITTFLGDALTGVTTMGRNSMQVRSSLDPVAVEATPSAIPIYDSARDSGTLVVSNLQPASGGEAYNLWVTIEDGKKPIHVGRLPEAMARGADSFDFSLGSTAIVPTGFYLTRDPRGKSTAPSGANTVLQGPR